MCCTWLGSPLRSQGFLPSTSVDGTTQEIHPSLQTPFLRQQREGKREKREERRENRVGEKMGEGKRVREKRGQERSEKRVREKRVREKRG